MRSVLLFTLVLASCEPTDEGLLPSVVTGGPLRPMVLPWHVVVADPDDEADVEAALALWSTWGRADGVPRAWFDMTWPSEPVPRLLGEVYVERWPLRESTAMEATLDENALGEIRWAIVTVNTRHLDADPEQRAAWFAHEFGHCLGLADDPSDLDESIMASPTRVGARLTEHDFDLLVEE